MYVYHITINLIFEVESNILFIHPVQKELKSDIYKLGVLDFYFQHVDNDFK